MAAPSGFSIASSPGSPLSWPFPFGTRRRLVCCSLHLRLWSLHAELLLTMGTRAEVGTKSLPLGPECFFFVVAPFCSCPASLVSRKFLAVGPGCAKCFFFCCAPLGAATFRRGQSKKNNTTQGVFFCSGPGECKGRRSPVGRRHGATAKKKHHPGCFFFCCGPGEKQGKEKPRWAPNGASPSPAFPRGRSKKKTPWVVFFFCSGPVPAPNGASPSLAFRRGRSKKKHPRWCFLFALAPCRRPTGLLLPLPFAGAAAKKKKKNTLGGVFFFAAAPRGRSLTHFGPGWRCLPLAGVVFLFFAAAPPGPGWCFFFCCGPARTLTHSRWAGAISARPGWCFFFLLRPRRVFLDNNKKMSGVLHRVEKDPAGPQQKKKHHFLPLAR